MTNSTVSIDALYNGAPGCGNGGYISGLMAQFIDGDAEIRIHRSFPVEAPLLVRRDVDSDSVTAWLGRQLLGTARPAHCQLEIPPPLDADTARSISGKSVFLHASDRRGCFVCSPLRSPGEGLGLAIGPVSNVESQPVGAHLAAALWRPDSHFADAHGQVLPVYVWSALDCPGVYALKLRYRELGILVLGSCTGSIKQPLHAGRDYIISAWQLAPIVDRKLHVGVAIHATDGTLMACARQVCFDIGKTIPTPP